MRAACLLLALGLVACEAPLTPIAPSDLNFSLSGYLDASADTQWVRVERFGEIDERPPGLLDVAVTLAGPGGEFTFAQTVRTFDSGPAHLFWTTAPIAPGQTYRIDVQDDDGARAHTDVRIPATDVGEVRLIDGVENCPTSVIIDGDSRVVDVQARYHLIEGPRAGARFRFSKVASIQRRPDGDLAASVFFGDDADVMDVSGIPWQAGIDFPTALVAVGTDDWPDVEDLTLEGALAAADAGLVEGGVGFVGGVITREIRFVPGVGFIPPPFSGLETLPCYP